MINVYVLGCGGIGGYIIDMLPMAIASLSLDMLEKGGYGIEKTLEQAGTEAIPCVVDSITLVDGDVFNTRNALRQGAGAGSKLVQRMKRIDNTILRKSYLRNMKIIGYPAYANPDNFRTLIPLEPSLNNDNKFVVSYVNRAPNKYKASIVFVCVDNLKTRYEVSKYMENFDNCLVINGGNEKTTGHVTFYERAAGVALDPNLYEVYTNVRPDADKRPDEENCTQIAPKHDQIAITNSIISNVMLAVFNKWLRDGLTSIVSRKGVPTPIRKNEILIDMENFTMSTLNHPVNS